MINISRKKLKITSNKLARMADGCAEVAVGQTTVMATCVRKTSVSATTFTPLIVDSIYSAASGHIASSISRREVNFSEAVILMGRLVDRSLRPLFPEGYNYETQIICNLLQLDGAHDPDIVAINAASTALALSDIPWNGPVGAVRVGFLDNQVLINPNRQELQNSALNLVVTGMKGNLVVMLDGLANNIPESDLMKSIESGVEECQKVVKGIEEFRKIHGKKKMEFASKELLDREKMDAVECFANLKLKEIFLNHGFDKISRDEAIGSLKTEVLDNMKKSYSDLDLTSVTEAYYRLSKKILRNLIMANDVRWGFEFVFEEFWDDGVFCC